LIFDVVSCLEGLQGYCYLVDGLKIYLVCFKILS